MTRFATIACFVVACALPGAALAAQVIKIATVSPEGSAWMDSMRAGAAEIRARTEGRVELKFYGGGVMGSDKKVLRKMRIGQLHGGTFTSGGLAGIYPDLQLYGLPLLFDNDREASFVRSRMDAALIEGLEKKGLVSFGLATGGFARLMSRDPVRTIDDLRGKKVWVPEGDVFSFAAMEALGLSPVTLPITDVLTGLQTGLVDIIGASAVGAVVLQWHTKVRYVTDLPVSYIYATLAIQKEAFDALTGADQQVVREVMTGIYKRFDEVNLRDDAEASAALRAGGIEYIQPKAAELPQWRQVTTRVNHELAERGELSVAMLNQLEEYLRGFRSTSVNAAASIE